MISDSISVNCLHHSLRAASNGAILRHCRRTVYLSGFQLARCRKCRSCLQKLCCLLSCFHSW